MLNQKALYKKKLEIIHIYDTKEDISTRKKNFIIYG